MPSKDIIELQNAIRSTHGCESRWEASVRVEDKFEGKTAWSGIVEVFSLIDRFESPGVEPVFATKQDAISYAQTRARFRTGKIRVLDSTGNVERTIAFDEKDRRL
jgi:hypothetical protein